MSKPKEPLQVPYVECSGIREYITYVDSRASGGYGPDAGL